MQLWYLPDPDTRPIELYTNILLALRERAVAVRYSYLYEDVREYVINGVDIILENDCAILKNKLVASTYFHTLNPANGNWSYFSTIRDYLQRALYYLIYGFYTYRRG